MKKRKNYKELANLIMDSAIFSVGVRCQICIHNLFAKKEKKEEKKPSSAGTTAGLKEMVAECSFNKDAQS